VNHPMGEITGENALSGAQHISHRRPSILALALASVGVVYGDIGTSPLYAFKVADRAAVGAGPIAPGAVLGVLSLIVWALIVTVTVKYVLVLLRADKQLSRLFAKVEITFDFMETPNIPKALAIARKRGWKFDIMSTSFYLSRRALKPALRSGMPRWQDRLFIALAKSASDASDFFQIPTGRVVEIGTQVTI